jgi:hypothetical protein
VTAKGQVVDARNNDIGGADQGDRFLRLDTPPNPPPALDDRYYGIVNGATGYFPQRKLAYVNTTLVCE